jgi:hypothetical protein
MKWSPFSPSTWIMISFLEAGMDGHGSWAIHASKNGLKLTLRGITVGRGKDPEELVANYEATADYLKRTGKLPTK